MAAQETSPFANADLALRICRATVKVVMGNAVWTGTIVGQKGGESLVLTVAHAVRQSAKWMSIRELNETITVRFYGSSDVVRCRVVKLEIMSDIMLLAVNRATPEEHKLRLAPEEEWDLVESQLLGARGHPQGRHQWTFTDGEVCTPNLINDDFYGVMPDYFNDMRFFEHRLDLGMGCSGAALVNLNGNIVGMQSGKPTKHYDLLASKKMTDAVDARKQQLVDEFNAKNKDESPLNLVGEMEELDLNIRNATVGLGSLEYGSNDAVNIPVSLSRIHYAIHVQYIKLRIQGTNQSLEDIYMADPSFRASSST